MKLLVSTLALTLAGGAAMLRAPSAQPCDPPWTQTVAQGDAPAPAPLAAKLQTKGLAQLLLQEPDAQVQQELERARRELERALAEAERERAELERELAREMERVQQEVRQARGETEREAQRAMRGAQRAAGEVRREAMAAREQALREAQHARQEALRDAERTREEAQREMQRAREQMLREARGARRGGERQELGWTAPSPAASERERRLEERIAVLERELDRRSAPQPERAPRRVFGLGVTPAAPAVPAVPAHPAHPAPTAGATGAPHPAPIAPGHGCCCCCSHHHAAHGSCSHHEGGQGPGEVGFLFTTPDVQIDELADVTFGDEGEWVVTWQQGPEDLEQQLAQLEAELGAEGHVFWGDLAVEPDATDILLELEADGAGCCEDGDACCEGEEAGACEDSGCEQEMIEVFFETLERQPEEPDAPQPERVHPPTPGVSSGVPSVVRFDDRGAPAVPGNTLFVPAQALRPVADDVEPLAGEVAELVEEMRSEVRSLREVLRALRQELRSGGLDEQL